MIEPSLKITSVSFPGANKNAAATIRTASQSEDARIKITIVYPPFAGEFVRQKEKL